MIYDSRRDLTANYEGSGYTRRPVPCKVICLNECCCYQCPRVNLASVTEGGNGLNYKSNCEICCPYNITVVSGGEDETALGSADNAACCDNGCCFACCPFCACMEVILWKFLTEDREIFATHRINQDCIYKCCICTALPWAVCLGQWLDLFAFLGDRNSLVYTEDLFSADLDNPVAIGQVVSSYYIQPVPYTCGCSTYRSLSRVSVRAYDVPDPAISLANRKNLSPILATHAYLQGRVVPLSLCSLLCGFVFGKAVMLVPSGTCCDLGRHSTVQRVTFEDAISMDAGAPGTTILDTKLSDQRVIGKEPKSLE